MESGWKSYEEIAAYLLNQLAKELGLSHVEGKQTIEGQRSGTRWTIDAKGVGKGNEGFIIVECRRYTKSKQNQEKIAALAYRIQDTGAQGGILVSPMGLQTGAEKVAQAESIISVELDVNCTPEEFSMRFLNKVMVGIRVGVMLSDRYGAEVIRVCERCGQRFTVKENERVCANCAQNT